MANKPNGSPTKAAPATGQDHCARTCLDGGRRIEGQPDLPGQGEVAMAFKFCPDVGHGRYQGRAFPKCRRDKDRRRGSAHSRGYDKAWQCMVRLAIQAQPWCSDAVLPPIQRAITSVRLSSAG
jgi:hypothetical protein